MRTLVWFRGEDLRLADHPALSSALSSREILPLFVLDPIALSPCRAQQSPHRLQFLLESVADLARALEARQSRLLLVRGEGHEVIVELIRRWKIDRVVAQAGAWPIGREHDRRVREACPAPFDTFHGATLMPPGTLRTSSGTPYRVYSPFARAFEASAVIDRPLPTVQALPRLPRDVAEDGIGQAALPTLAELGLSRNPRLQPGGESQGRERLAAFLKGGLDRYHERRDRMDLAGTSRLSCDLRMGTLSVREVWTRVREADREGRAAFQNELCWREFCHSTLWDQPELLEEPFQARFEHFPWRQDTLAWNAWVNGETGYPIVDASARQLLAEGFVHNRARMISASFLCKHLLIDYKQGEAHFMRYLTDGDPANNNAGWQWSAGCGCDAQPYFRVFNPVTQGKKFDPDGAYVRRWVPRLSALPTPFIHAPSQATADVLERADVRLGTDYPRPIVEHAAARQSFLETARRHFGAP